MLRSVLFRPPKNLIVFTLLNLKCCKCARMRFHCMNGVVVLRIRALWRERWFPPIAQLNSVIEPPRLVK